MKKKQFIICLLVALTSFSYAQTTFEDNFITYRTIDANSVQIRDYDTSGGTVVNIPSSVTHNNITYSVTQIANNAFRDNNLTSVTIPSSVTRISNSAFANNQLTSVVISNSVISIGQRAFENNQLTSVVIPNSIRIIDSSAFANNQLTSVVIPSSTTRIKREAFENNKLTSVSIPNSVIKIETSAFANNQLTNVNIPDSLTSIWSRVFANNELTSVIIPNSVTAINGEAFANNQLTSVSIPNTVTSIDNYAFKNNQLTSISIPNSLTSIGHGAFAGNQLTSVVIPNSLTIIWGDTFANNQLTAVNIPNSITYIDKGAFRNNQLTNISIPNSITSIQSEVFKNNQLTSITIPSSVISISSGAFENNQLTKVISDNLNPPEINVSVFENNSEIELMIPEGATDCYLEAGWVGFKDINAGDSRFENLTFTNQGLEYTITSIDKKYVSVLGRNSENTNTDINIPQEVTYNNTTYKVTSIGSHAFDSNQLTSISIPNSVISIESFAFNSNQLTSLSIPKSVTSIGFGAFGSNQLTSINIPNSVTSIESFAFDSNQLTSVSISNSVKTIGFGAFRFNKLTSVVIPNSVTTIGKDAFDSNQLTSVSIPNSVITIESRAFDYNLLTNINFQGKVPPLVIEISLSRRKGIDLLVPKGSINTYLDAGYTGFKSISDGTTMLDNLFFSSNGFNFYINSLKLNTVTILSKTIDNTAKEITIPETLKYDNIDYVVNKIQEYAFLNDDLISVSIPNSITNIGIGAFFNNDLTSIIIPNSVTFIGRDAFTANKLTSIISLNEIPVKLTNNSISLNEVPVKPESSNIIRIINLALRERADIDLVVPEGFIDAYLEAGWIDFKSISDGITSIENLHFTSNGFDYRVNSTKHNTVTVLGKNLDNRDTEITIPETLTYNNIIYTVNKIEKSAFTRDWLRSAKLQSEPVFDNKNIPYSGNQLTSVIIPNSVTFIGSFAFFNNALTSITIPENVTTIEESAFDSNQITEVTSLSTTPASLLENNNTTFGKNSNIDLTIPVGTLDTYENNGWTGFKSVTENPTLSTEAIALTDTNGIHFKNPVGGQLEVFTNTPIKLISVFDITGKKLLETKAINTTALGDLQSGMYIIHFTTANGVVSKRMIKE